MWYFAWILGLGFAVLLAILSAVWIEFEKGRLEAFGEKKLDTSRGDIDKETGKSEKIDEATKDLS